jgi:aspartate kinase
MLERLQRARCRWSPASRAWPDNRITTLGRGGSDTSAVALAAALKADRCDIYTDVDGVYTTDPRIVTKARKLDKITYEEMLELASQGAKVLQTRSVELAMNHRVRVQVLSSFEDLPGTLVVDEEEIVEQERRQRHRLRRGTRRRSRSRACRTGPASPPPSSARSRMPTPSTST